MGLMLRKRILFVSIQIVCVVVKIASAELHERSGPYLGQQPPGMIPEKFAPGLISIDEYHDFKGAFSPDGKEYYFCRHKLPEMQPTLFFTKIENGKWTQPTELPVAQGARTFHPCISPDNKVLLFSWQFRGDQDDQSGFYAARRTESGWSKAKFAGQGAYLTASQSGLFYTMEIVRGEQIKFYINEVNLKDGVFENYTRQHISPHYGLQTHPCIAPDGGYLIFDTQEEKSRIFVSFKDPNGKWGEGIDLTQHGLKPGMRSGYISPDGKYLFLGYEGDIWWVDIQIIEQLRPMKEY